MLALDGMNGSGQSGVMRLTAKGQKTEVVIDVTPGGAGVAQPVHIHSGSCADLGGVQWSLESVVDGKSSTTVAAPITSILINARAVNLHKSGSEAGTYTSCGDLPQLGAVASFALDALIDSGQSGTATLVDAGDETRGAVWVASIGDGVAQPIHIHSGSCGSGLGGVAHGLTAAVDGVSVTTAAVKLEDLLAGEFAINLHKSAAEAGVYTACSNLAGSGGAGDAADSGSRQHNRRLWSRASSTSSLRR